MQRINAQSELFHPIGNANKIPRKQAHRGADLPRFPCQGVGVGYLPALRVPHLEERSDALRGSGVEILLLL